MEAQYDRPRLDLYSDPLQGWMMSEIQEMVEQMTEMGHNRMEEVKKLQMGVGRVTHDVVDVVMGLKSLKEVLAHVRKLRISEQELIRSLGLEQVWEEERQERREWWEKEREREREKQEQEREEREERHEQQHELQEQQEQNTLQGLQEHQQPQWLRPLLELIQVLPPLRALTLPWLFWKQAIPTFLKMLLGSLGGPRQEQLRWWIEQEERKDRVRVVLGQVEARLKRELERPGGRNGQENLLQLLGLVQHGIVQLMEPWHEQQKRQQHEEILQQEEQQLHWMLHRLRQVRHQLGRMIRRQRREQSGIPLPVRLIVAQEPPNWEELDRLMSFPVSQGLIPLTKQQTEHIRARLIPKVRRRTPLLEVICDNHKRCVDQSPYLDSLLVFAGLFSAILSAFLIDVRKGLQEDLLLEILHHLQSAQQTPFQPTLVSVWVNGLWFSSLAASLIGAFSIMLAKSLSGWTISDEQAQVIFSAPEHFRRRYKEIKCIGAHARFESQFSILTATASALIYVAFLLFGCGISVLLYTTQKSIGIGFLSLTLIVGYGVFSVAGDSLFTFYTN